MAIAPISLLLSTGCGGSVSARASGPTGSGSRSSGAPGRTAVCRRPLPEGLAFPAGQALQLQLEATGVQIYTCTAAASAPVWVFTAPEATLRTLDGEPAGRHFAGPTWEAQDGSQVVGAKVTGASPDPTAIPWLLLRAVSHAGHGALSEVTSVQRVATSGGLAPADGCGAATLGAVARVPYTASYCFAEAQ